ncbi:MULTISPECIES: hypothetical protein [Corynebacterium]|uniref:hypothetical protein n=1 Tax=Corynebacterium TaxID=1716 RepID=UPI00124DDA8E|nr:MULTISPECIES: hypothetical protein [Corynebacterium]
MTNTGLTLDQLLAELERAGTQGAEEQANVLLAATNPLAPDWSEADYGALRLILDDHYTALLGREVENMCFNRGPVLADTLRQLNQRQLAVALVLGTTPALQNAQAWLACSEYLYQDPTFNQRQALLERMDADSLKLLDLLYEHYDATQQAAEQQQAEQREAEQREAETDPTCATSMAEYFGDEAYAQGHRMADFPYPLEEYFAPLATAQPDLVEHCATLFTAQLYAEAKGNQMIPPARVPEFAKIFDQYVLARAASESALPEMAPALHAWMQVIPLLPASMVADIPRLSRYLSLGNHLEAQARNPDDVRTVLPLFLTYVDAAQYFNDYKAVAVSLVSMCRLAESVGPETQRAALDKALPILHDACFTEHATTVTTQYLYLVRQSAQLRHSSGEYEAAIQEAERCGGIFDIDQLSPAAAKQLAYLYELHAALLHQLRGPQASAPLFKKTLRAFRQLGMDEDAHRVKTRFTTGR